MHVHARFLFKPCTCLTARARRGPTRLLDGTLLDIPVRGAALKCAMPPS